jgi:Flp pilus assembly protein TadD
LTINGNNVEALTGLAAVYHEGQRSDEAEEKYRQAVGVQPGNWRTYNALGTFLFRLGRYDEAAENYRRVISLDSWNPQGYDNLGAALMLSGDFARAAPAFSRSIEIEPTRTAYSNLGMLYYYLDDLDRSVVAHEKAAELAPNDHLTWSNLGDALSFTEESDRAKASFRRAEELAESKLAVNPTDAETMIELAWIKAMLGKKREALDLIEPAKRMKSQDPYVRFISGLVLVKAEETTRAYEDLEAAIEMGFPWQMLSAEPHLRTLRGESRYMALAESKAVR